MAWIILVLAGIFEIIWAYSMKLSEGFTKPIPTLITLIFVILSFMLLSYSMRVLPLGTAYSIWSGIGAVGSFVIGIIILGEQANLIRIVAALMIVGGLLLMKLST
ncbi:MULTISPECIES: DMT family transporter [Acinetobacter]|jgi:quaternary ammonium compound-resistance protein SugE|uniref:Guanidinium exporter n=1 Tax=Acinetobacter chengduensis TaxID=2420890 RepID=A0ABX9TRI5_9GAMM|nr:MULTISPECIES: multidrug efflux SMR transporter [Acinetobacter]MBI1453703.1 multidrug efflux SMR transporter [Acinetobacter sp. FL51]RKG36815.1 QacE family quaternary ammonium compound efflux SMR transporter [Acinetobacter sp. WCHAc060007]RLL16341.1 QacE family quaternary ammonium compound efflux SMR transporter [Acinetobacter chengduensis]